MPFYFKFTIHVLTLQFENTRARVAKYMFGIREMV